MYMQFKGVCFRSDDIKYFRKIDSVEGEDKFGLELCLDIQKFLFACESQKECEQLFDTLITWMRDLEMNDLQPDDYLRDVGFIAKKKKS